MNRKPTILLVLFALVTAALAGCAAPEEAGDNATDDGLGDTNDTDDDTGDMNETEDDDIILDNETEDNTTDTTA